MSNKGHGVQNSLTQKTNWYFNLVINKNHHRTNVLYSNLIVFIKNKKNCKMNCGSDYQLCLIKGIIFVICMCLSQHSKEKRINLRPFDGM